jgi:hypothetical protein
MNGPTSHTDRWFSNDFEFGASILVAAMVWHIGKPILNRIPHGDLYGADVPLLGVVRNREGASRSDTSENTIE